MRATLENGILVEGTPAEIAAVIRELGTRESGSRTNHRASTNGESSLAWADTTLDTFWKRLSIEQRKLIEYTLKKGPVTLKQLMDHLDKKEGIDIAGLLAAITRHAHSVAGEASLPVIDKVRSDTGKCYEITSELRTQLQGVLSRQNGTL